MKKPLAVILEILMIISLCACSLEADVPHPPAYVPVREPVATYGYEKAAAPKGQGQSCTAEGSGYQTKGEPVPHASGKYSVRVNNLKISTFYIHNGMIEGGGPIDFTPAGSSFSGYFIRISGLKDKALEEDINRRIYEKYAALASDRSIPPYVGAKLKEKALQDWEQNSQFCYVDVGLNAENMLSLCFTSHRSFVNKSKTAYFTVYAMDGMNLDLRTGNEISIRELFADDVDGLAWLDHQMEDYIAKHDSYDDRTSFTMGWYDTGLSLAMPFPGIAEDQKYYINGFSGQLNLIFDYNTPWVYCDYMARSLSFDIVPVAAYSGRFPSAKSIFEDETADYLLLSRYYDRSDMVTENRNEDMNVGSSGLKDYVHVSSSYLKDMTKEQIAYVSTGSDTVNKYLELYYSKRDELKELYNGYVSSHLNISDYCSRVGDFVNVRSTMQLNFTRTVYPSDVLYEETVQRNLVFRGDSSSPESFSTIFRPGVYWEERLYNAFKANWQRVLDTPDGEGLDQGLRYLDADYVRGLGIDEKALDAFFMEASRSASSFSMGNRYLELFYGSALRDLSMKYFGHTGGEKGEKADNDILFTVETLVSGVYYRDLGAEDMTIF